MSHSSPSQYTPALLAVLAAILALSPVLSATDNAEIQELRAQIHALEDRLLQLERRQQLAEKDAATVVDTAPKVIVTDKGFTLASHDGGNSIRLRGLAQLDSRLFFHDGGIANNAFVLRRARLITEGTLARNYQFQFVTEFGGTGAPSILDANIGVTLSKALQFKAGKFKVPVGHELLQSDSWTFFNERSMVTNLVPNRDLGVQASGDVLNDMLHGTVGVFGGVGDAGSSNNGDFDNDKDMVARIIATPWGKDMDSALQDLTFGLAGSLGRAKTADGRTAGYRTDGQQTFFSYLATTLADGRNWRIAPQFDYRCGSFGAMGEYVVSTISVRNDALGALVPPAKLQNRGWQLAAAYVLTGEDSSYNGVVPHTDFDFSSGTWGAFEVASRYSDLKVDSDAFPLFASAATSANEASSIGIGLNWYLSKAAMLKLDYYQTRFYFNSAAPAVSTTPALRQDEKTFISRIQLSF